MLDCACPTACFHEYTPRGRLIRALMPACIIYNLVMCAYVNAELFEFSGRFILFRWLQNALQADLNPIGPEPVNPTSQRA